MIKIIFLSLAFIAFLPMENAMSMVGVDAPVAGDVSPYSCRLVIRGPDHSLVGVCSGILISSREVATAAHCISPLKDKLRQAYVECDYTPSEMGSTETTKAGREFQIDGVNFREKHYIESAWIHENYNEKRNLNDSGILVLQEPSSLDAMKFSDSESMINKFETDALGRILNLSKFECRFSGYGLSATGVGGRLLMAAANKNIYLTPSALSLSTVNTLEVRSEDLDSISKLEKSEDKTFAILKKGYALSFQGMPGDSGGGFFCRERESVTFQLIAILSSGDVRQFGDKELWFLSRFSLFNRNSIKIRVR